LLAALLNGVKREDLVEVVDDVGGVFLEEVYGGVVLYLTLFPTSFCCQLSHLLRQRA
jgi:hypothetical protein